MWIIGGIIGIILGFVLGWFLKPTQKSEENIIDNLEKQKEANLQKARNFIKDKDKITNEEIQDLLKVSDATAERYLDELEKESLVKQVGNTGQSVYYKVNT